MGNTDNTSNLNPGASINNQFTLILKSAAFGREADKMTNECEESIWNNIQLRHITNELSQGVLGEHGRELEKV